jgi:hypothetical protein
MLIPAPAEMDESQGCILEFEHRFIRLLPPRDLGRAVWDWLRGEGRGRDAPQMLSDNRIKQLRCGRMQRKSHLFDFDRIGVRMLDN